MHAGDHHGHSQGGKGHGPNDHAAHGHGAHGHDAHAAHGGHGHDAHGHGGHGHDAPPLEIVPMGGALFTLLACVVLPALAGLAIPLSGMVGHVSLLTTLTFAPAIAALLLCVAAPFFGPKADGMLRCTTLSVVSFVFGMSIYLLLPETANQINTGRFSTSPAAVAEMQNVFNFPWIPSFQIQYFMGTDGISVILVLLTTFLFVLAMGASWSIEKNVLAYCVLFLILETGVIGVFLSLDFFLFYVFWEVMLLPMYFLIGVWGGPRREYAALKFFLYTLLGGVLMLVAVLMLFFTSDLKALTDAQLSAAHVIDGALNPEQRAEAIAAIRETQGPVHTFNILALQQLGQHTDLFTKPNFFLGHTLQWWAFVLLFIGFAIKVPSVPVHTWLPDAHVEAPTPISMLLAGILLKLGGYGILRICYPICPAAAYELAGVVCGLGVVSMVYGAFAALNQTDFKRLVAYSSVSHMGYVVLGMGVASATAGNLYNTGYWKFGMNGAMFQMIAHGISSAGMFFMVGVVYDRVHHRMLNQFGGLMARMPVYSAMAFIVFFAGLGLPGLCGFIGEVFVTLSVWNYSRTLAIVGAAVVILTAAYILWTIQRVYLGAEYRGPHGDHLTPFKAREFLVALPLCVLAVVFGVYPPAVLNYISPAVNKTVDNLAEWKQIQDGVTKSAVQQVDAGKLEGIDLTSGTTVSANIPGIIGD